ncbi:ankyrin repeat domain-containing protein [Dyella choica]|uniref:Ankyrin repeat domain-containing protein n=1 Tax=Dyella choica TaxID=1927959 RepID=A0A3S0RNA8_9GAMM|nr:ankyrin repeat domain-containing protein [Dyella choica]RUL79922.1 ankyrin repeat domain-containing protein [Dyella choica]
MNIDELLAEYQTLPEYSGLVLNDVNKKSLFNDYPINIAATRGSIDEMGLLLNNGADINAVGEHGYLPIHDAVEQDKFEAILWLINNGANVNAKNDDGITPMELAIILGHKNSINALDKK